MQDKGTDQKFQDLSRQILEEQWAFYPTAASELGLHQYDGRLPDLSSGAVRRRLQEIRHGLDRLATTDHQRLFAQERTDYQLLELALKKEHFDLAELRILETDPMRQLGYLNVTNYIQRDYAPLADRVRSLNQLLSQVPDFLSSALGSLNVGAQGHEPLPSRPILDMSIESYEGMARFYRVDLGKVTTELTDRALLAQLNQAREEAARAVDSFVGALRERLGRASPNFAIGPELYQKMLLYGEMVDLPLSRVLEVGQADLERNLEALAEAAARAGLSRTVRELIEAMSEDHPSADRLIPDTALILEDIRQFIIDRDILTVPSEERCQVMETPSFMRWAFAAMDTPGLLESKATESYYYVTPVEPHWTERQKEEWLRDFDYNTIQIVSIHEVYPGHFVHSLHGRTAPSLVSKALRSYSFSEGWAHYTEEMMLEAGYGHDNPSLKLAQICDALLRDCRYLCSIGMHTQGMSVEEATRFFMEKAFMGEFPARKEALRGTFDPGYLNYTLGKLMILKLREDYREEKGASFSLKEFHDRLLSYGAPPVPLLREAMLRNPPTPPL